MDFLPLLNQPITQFAGFVIVLFTLQKAGVDVSGIVRALWSGKQRGAAEELSADFRNAFQPLLSEMEQLKLYANHETTAGLDLVAKSIEGLHQKLDLHVRQQDRTNFILEEIKDNGIKCRKD